MKRKLFVFSLAVLIILPLFSSDDIENIILSALDEFKKGNTEKTVEFLSKAIMLMNNKKDFQIREIVLCTDVQDYRGYSKKSGNLKAGETLLLYIEPEGYQVVEENNTYKIHVSEDISIVDEKGKVVFEKKDWLVYEKGFPTPIIPFYITNKFTDMPAGKYKYTLTLKDHFKKTFTTETFEFTVE